MLVATFAGCEQQIHHEYAFATGGDGESAFAARTDEQIGVWSMSAPNHSVHIRQRGQFDQFRLTVIVTSNDRRPGDPAGDENRFLYFSLAGNTSCPSRIEHFDDPRNSANNFLYPGLDDLYTYDIPITPPGRRAIVHVVPCDNEVGNLELVVFSDDGDVLARHTILLRVVEAGRFWKTIFDSPAL